MKAWETKRLGDLIELLSGQHIDAKDYNAEQRGIGYLTGPSDFGDLHPVISKWTEFPKVTARKDDILITVKGSGVGKINLLDEDEVAISRQLMAIRVTNADRTFVYLFLSSVFDHFQNASTGAAIPGISREQVLALPIAVPPLAEQQRIVGLLNEAFEGLATAKANAEKNLQNARALFESHLQSVFSQRGAGWVETTLAAVTGGIYTGPFGSLLHKSDYVENGIPLVNPAHITDVGIEPDMRKTVSKTTALRLKSYIMSEGDIVIGRRGEMGRCALVTDVEDGWLCGTGSFFIKPSSRCDTRYLVRFLRSESCKARLEKIAGGAVMPNLSNTDLGNLTFDLPPLDRQKAIVEETDRVHEETQRLVRVYEQKLAVLEALKKSLLHQAFSGELTAGAAKAVPAPVSSTVTSFVPELVVLPDITTLDLHAGIQAMAFLRHEEHGEYSFGHVKAEKSVHVVEAWAGIELGRRPVKDAAGPVDSLRLDEVGEHARKEGYFIFERPEGESRFRLTKGPAFDALIAKTERALDKRKAEVDHLLKILAAMDRRQAEIVTTVHAAWNNLLLDGETVTDERIVTEARENWHPKKMGIDRDRFFKALAWIREKELVPSGRGKRVVDKPA